MMIRVMAALAAAVFMLAACDSGGDGDGGTAGGSTEAFCNVGEDVESLLEGDGFDASDPASIASAIEEFGDLLDRAVEVAPDEIQDDVDTVARIQGEAFEAMSGPLQEIVANPEAAQDPEAFQRLQEAFAEAEPTPEEQEELDEAQARVDEFLEEECGIDTDSDGGDSGTDESDDGGEGGGGSPFGS